METYLGLDVGTSSVRALLIDGAQRVVAVGSAPLAVMRPRPLWSEQDPELWWQACLAAVGEVRAAAPQAWRPLQAIGLSGQMHGRWDDVLLAATDLTEAHMPRLVEGSQVSAELSPELAGEWGLSQTHVPIAGGAGDNAASAIGIGAVRAGEGFLSLGTSGVVFAVADHFVSRPERTLHAFCHALPGRWHGMGVMLAAGDALSWAAALVGQQHDVSGLLERVSLWAASVSHREAAPVFLPYINGERTPHNDPGASGMFAGLRAEHGTEALGYAVLEGVAFALSDNYAVMMEAGATLHECMLVGGGARSPFWSQLIADAVQLPLLLAEGAETGAALGAARLAMLAADAGDEAAVCGRPDIRRVFTPDPATAAVLAPRRRRFRALYPAEKALRG